MSTPTPRTDAQAGWAIANQYGQSTGSELLGDPDGMFVHAVFARTLERELNAERARLDWLMAGGVCMIQHSGGFYISRLYAHVSRAAIDAAMKEDGA
jgi:hypothetical protein